MNTNEIKTQKNTKNDISFTCLNSKQILLMIQK